MLVVIGVMFLCSNQAVAYPTSTYPTYSPTSSPTSTYPTYSPTPSPTSTYPTTSPSPTPSPCLTCVCPLAGYKSPEDTGNGECKTVAKTVDRKVCNYYWATDKCVHEDAPYTYESESCGEAGGAVEIQACGVKLNPSSDECSKRERPDGALGNYTKCERNSTVRDSIDWNHKLPGGDYPNPQDLLCNTEYESIAVKQECESLPPEVDEDGDSKEPKVELFEQCSQMDPSFNPDPVGFCAGGQCQIQITCPDGTIEHYPAGTGVSCVAPGACATPSVTPTL